MLDVPASWPAKLRLEAESVRVGPLMVKLSAPDNPPPGAGLKTVTWAVPGAAKSLARMSAVS